MQEHGTSIVSSGDTVLYHTEYNTVRYYKLRVLGARHPEGTFHQNILYQSISSRHKTQG